MKVNGGRFYDQDGREVPEQAPDVWVCRRVINFPGGKAPEGSSVTFCTHCRARIAYNPARKVTAPKVCMQCAGYEPLPFTDEPGDLGSGVKK